MSTTMTSGQIQDLFGKFATENPVYRDALIADPKGIFEKQLNTTLPENVTVKAVVETADTIYVVVPHVAVEGELDDADLAQVAGGGGHAGSNANCSIGGSGNLNTFIQIGL